MTRLTMIRLGLLTWILSARAFSSEWNTRDYDLYPGDFNGDGATDVLYVAKSSTGRSGIALSNGIEWVAGAQSWDSDGFGLQWHSAAYVPVIGDFNWDGRDDIFMHRQTPGDHVLILSQIDGTFSGSSQTISNARAGLVWSGDQHKIIAVKGKSADPAHPKGHRLFLQAVSAGGANAIIDTGFSQLIGASIVGSSWSDGYRGFKWNLKESVVQSADFNGDGEGDFLIQAKAKIVIIDYDPPFPIPVSPPASFGIVYSPIANGITDFWDRMVAGIDWSAANSNLVIGDFNGDGKDDVIVQPRSSSNSTSLILTNATTNLLNRSSPLAISFSNAPAAGGDSYRSIAANINGTLSERAFGLYMQGVNPASTDLIANNIVYGGGTIATVSQSISSQVAGSAEKPYTMAYRYNLRGQVTGTIVPDPDKQNSPDGPLKYLATRNTYDRGLLVRVETGELQRWVNESVAPSSWESVTGFTKFVITEYSYDEYGRRVKEIVKRGDTGTIESLVQSNYDSASRVFCRAVRMNKDDFVAPPSDACQQGTSMEGLPQDRISKFTYDDLDQVLTEQRGVGTSLLQTYVRNQYANRRLLSQTDANGNKTEYKYDAIGRLERRIFPSATTGAGAANPNDYESFTYEPTGKIKTERKRNGKVVTYFYDSANRVIHRDLSDNSHSPNIYFDYYPTGALRYARFGGAAGPGITNSVDAFGRLEWSRTNTAAATSSSGPYRQLSYEYDDNGNRTRITHPDNQFFGYTYDGLNRLCGVAESAIPALCSSQGLVVSVAYRNDGGRAAVSRGGVTTTYSPDGLGRLAAFTLDLPGGSGNDLTNQFSYNAIGQITQLTQSNTAYSYTGNANRVGTYSRNGLNQVTRVAGQDLAYDANGNLTTDQGVNYSMTYDMENRLVATSGASTVTSSLKYDPAGRLSQLTVDHTAREFLYDGDSLVAEYESGVIKRRFVHSNQIDEPWVEYTDIQVGPANRRYLFADHQGSIIASTNGDDPSVKKLAYDSFGIPQDTNDGRFGYTGQVWIPALGLYHYKARMYSPRLGRFLQTDAVLYKDGMNLYAYVGNDPMSLSDPYGLNACPSDDKNCVDDPQTEKEGEPQPGPDGRTSQMDVIVVRARRARRFSDNTRIRFPSEGELEQGFRVDAVGTGILPKPFSETGWQKCSDGSRRRANSLKINDLGQYESAGHTHGGGELGPLPGPEDGVMAAATGKTAYHMSIRGVFAIERTAVGFRVRTLRLFGRQTLAKGELAELHERIAAWNNFGGASGATCVFTPD